MHDFKNKILNVTSKYSVHTRVCCRNLAELELIRLFLNPDVFYVLFEDLKEKGCLLWRMYESFSPSVCV